MFQAQIKGVELAKVIRNAMLWQEPGVKWTQKSEEEPGGRVILSFAVAELSFYATDGYAAVRDFIEYSEAIPHFTPGKTREFWFTDDEMEALLAMAVDSKTGPLTLRWDQDHVQLDYSVSVDDKKKIILGEGSVFFGEPTEFPDWAEGLEDALELAENPEKGDRMSMSEFALRPERLVKFLRVRADKEAPVDFRFLVPMNSKSGPMAAVKIGHTFRGLVNFVNRDVAREKLPEEQKGFMW
jgi:alpha-glucosidase (family GH31 glycosyl hydrolase)